MIVCYIILERGYRILLISWVFNEEEDSWILLYTDIGYFYFRVSGGEVPNSISQHLGWSVHQYLATMFSNYEIITL